MLMPKRVKRRKQFRGSMRGKAYIYPTPFTASIESVVSFSNNLRKREMLLFRLS